MASPYSSGSGSAPARSRGGGGARRDLGVEILGLNELRKNLRSIDRKLGLEVNKYLRAFAMDARNRARKRAPIVSGALRKSIKHSVKARQVSLYSDLAYAPAHEWGSSNNATGRVRPRGVPIRIRRTQMLGYTVYSRSDEFEKHVMGLVDHVARTNGFDD